MRPARLLHVLLVSASLVPTPARAADSDVTVELAKRLLREGQDMKLAPLLELSAAYQALSHATADHEEAVAAFLDKRKPQFTER